MQQKSTIDQMQHEFTHLIVVDFEAQCDNIKDQEPQEIIEFPAVVIDLLQGKILEQKFHHYVRPVIYPTLTDFCKQLTGITQEKVDNGLLLEDALRQFHIFLQENDLLDKDFAFVTDGDADLEEFLPLECKHKNIQYANYLKKYINIKEVFVRRLGVQQWPLRLSNMLEYVKLQSKGNLHSGIDDSLNIARVVIALVQQHSVKFTKDLLTTVIIDVVIEKHIQRQQKQQQWRPGDWLCETCNKHNYAIRQKCFSCNQNRKFTQQTSTAVNNQLDTAKSYQANKIVHNDWLCGHCNKLNFENRIRCFGCNAAKFPVQESEKIVQQQQEILKGAIQVDVQRDAQAYRQQIAVRPGDWFCSKCNFHNYASRNQCKKCDTPKK